MTEQDPDAPYAGPEAPAWVAELLAGLPADDPPIPEDVAVRLDAVLAQLAESTTTDPGTSGTGHATPYPDGVADATGTSNVVALSSATARHSARANPWPHRLLLGGVAAVAVVALGGLSTLAVLRGSSPSADGQVAAASGAGASAPDTRYVASGASYTSANLAATTGALLRADGQAVAPGPSRTSPATGPLTGTPPESTTGTTAAPSATPAVTSDVLSLKDAGSRPQPSCLQSLAGSADVEPLVVDEATYDAHPAFVVVFATANEPATVDVWVVARSCAEGAEGLYTFARVAR